MSEKRVFLKSHGFNRKSVANLRVGKNSNVRFWHRAAVAALTN